MSIVYLALASSLGDREKHLRDALKQIETFVALTRVSSMYETGLTNEHPRTVHLVCYGTTKLQPIDVYRRTHRIEKEMGRNDGLRSHPRPMDIDLLLYDRLITLSPALTIPHPRMHERAAVLMALNEIAPNVKHPRLRLTAQELLARLNDDEAVWVYKKI
jgi:2-amino-4-hydroxy-6-hydroxymethyldihydropteridine diphosphokinase